MKRVVALGKLNPAPLKFVTNDRTAFDLNLFLGVTVFGILPQVAAVAYYGMLLAEILFVSLSAGIGLGFAMRRFSPCRLQTLGISTSTHLQVSETLKKAA
jgi:hypothetical protein